MKIKELTTREEWKAAFPVMKQLRKHLDEENDLQLVEAAAKTSDYKMAAVIDGGNIVAVTGYMPMITLYNGRFIWVYDLVTDEVHRSKGYGARLLAYVEKQASENGYGIVSLSSDLQRKDAHRFYEEKMDYDKVSYVF
ncbi:MULTISPECIES: GNAT family N-acetyltransferase [Heyndrickxia]|uniref:GNAT family N-acetyltransferase n=1 Tax=Heyndrickxia TaxID=2837504 RepID=UPI0003739C64|nr:MULTISPECIES: GNAT family N-acetyltransferase [Heyndrickxia]MBQ4910717.1 GNAT family N-acetyltransferase [Heyndrickxia faecalis]APB36129.1 GNAT family N-acetyltransferase [Heyndrickxia coagulans]AWP36983.1 N-acetyltransferase [Heyndrickxia coagulans]KYC63482.1 hypothetical protein B4100_3524 [Heyndrickxia coagulans]MEC2224027.1 GNAT family N-acetyltransferase [Weizmannia sp. CD-2023]